MNRDGTILTKLFFSFVYLANEIYKPITRFGHTLFGPVSELELSYRPRRSVPGISYFKLSENVLRHVVLRNWINYKTLVSN